MGFVQSLPLTAADACRHSPTSPLPQGERGLLPNVQKPSLHKDHCRRHLIPSPLAGEGQGEGVVASAEEQAA